jgi:hypothetical protein
MRIDEDKIEIAVAHLLDVSYLTGGPLLYPDCIGTKYFEENDEVIVETKKIGKRKQKVKTLNRYNKALKFEGSAEGYLASCKELEGYEAEWLLDEETNIWTLSLFGGKMFQLESVGTYFGMDFATAQSIFTRQGYTEVHIYPWDVAAKMICTFLPRKVEGYLSLFMQDSLFN